MILGFPDVGVWISAKPRPAMDASVIREVGIEGSK